MAPSLTPGEQRRRLGLQRRKARQEAFAKKHNEGTYPMRLRKTIAQIAGLKARQARRRKDFTHKLTTDLAKSHGWVAIEDLRVKNMTKSAKRTRGKPGKNVRQKAGLNRAILDNAPTNAAASSATRPADSAQSGGSLPPAGHLRPAPNAMSGTRSPGPDAGGCSPAPPAATPSTRTAMRPRISGVEG